MQSFACSLCFEAGQHKGCIDIVNFSPDETKLLTQSSDGTAKVWDAQTGALLLTVPLYDSYEEPSRLCCFSPCGELIVSCSASGKDLTLLRASDGSTVTTAPDAFGGTDRICSSAFAPDGLCLAVGSDEGGVRLFSVPELKLLSTLPRERDYEVFSVAFTADGHSLLVAARTSVEVCDVAPGGQLKLRHALRKTGAFRASVSPEGKHAVAGGLAGEPVDIWELGSGARALQLPAEFAVRIACWLPSGDAIATCSTAGVIRFWSFSSSDPGSSGQLLGSIDVFGGRPRGDVNVYELCLSPSGGVFACAGAGNGYALPFLRVFRAPTLSPFQRQLGELLRSKRGADVTLACAGNGTDTGSGDVAHSLILALRSGTLQRQLDWGVEREGGAAAAAGGGASGTSRLEIDGSVEPAILERLLEYMYTDHLVIESANEAQHLLHAAAFYDVPGLFQLCVPVLDRLLAAENVVETLIAADKFGAAAAELKLAALRFVKDNADAVLSSPGWDQRFSKRLLAEVVYFQGTGKLLPAALPEQQQPEGANAVVPGGPDGHAAVAAAGAGGTGEPAGSSTATTSWQNVVRRRLPAACMWTDGAGLPQGVVMLADTAPEAAVVGEVEKQQRAGEREGGATAQLSGSGSLGAAAGARKPLQTEDDGGQTGAEKLR